MENQTIDLEEIAKRMFLHNVTTYADPAMAELAWVDPQIRQFWLDQAGAIFPEFK